MPLFDRRCQACNHKEDDLFESIHTGLVEKCPKCQALTFAKCFTAPHLPPDGLYSFNSQLDNMRAKASEGHGNASYKM